MTCIEISELNGAAGNKDYFRKSREAEALVLKSVSRLLQRPIQETPGSGVHACDFSTAQGYVGDVKIWSGSAVKVELSQVQRGVRVPGWFVSYQKLNTFAGILAVNHWNSAYLGQGVFKIRWITWCSIMQGVSQARQIHNSRGIYCELDPTQLEHHWLGDFMQIPSQHGHRHKAFDVSRIHTNPRLQISQLHTWF